jgi:2-dehydropantoate 2-reductase
MKVAIVGAGALGCYYGAMLQRSGQDVHFLMRSDYQWVRQHGLQIRSYLGDFQLPQVQAHASSAEIGVSDLVIISLKTTDNEALKNILPPLIGKSTLLLTLQNGLGNEEFLAENFGAEHVLGGVCFVCINRLGPGMIDHSSNGNIEIGDFSGQHAAELQKVHDMFVAAGIESAVSENLKATRWKKLVWNIPFNGLAVSEGGITVDRILQNPGLLQRLRALMREVLAAAGAEGVEITQAYADWQVERTYPMGAYHPSTLLDFQAGKPLELEAIWGEPLRRAERLGISVPELDRLYRQLNRRAINGKPV